MRSLVLALVLAWSAVVHADAKADARVHVSAADTAFKLGQFDQALAEYGKAYELFPAPALLFNLGQCHRNLKNWERAIFFFQGYLRDDPNASNRELVEELISEAQGELAKQQAAASTEAELRLTAEKNQAEAAEAQRRIAEVTLQRNEDERLRALLDIHHPDDRFYRKWWFWTAVGGAALAVGGTTYFFATRTTLVEPTTTLGGLDRR